MRPKLGLVLTVVTSGVGVHAFVLAALPLMNLGRVAKRVIVLIELLLVTVVVVVVVVVIIVKKSGTGWLITAGL